MFRTTKEKFLFCGSNRWTRGFCRSVVSGEALWIFRPVDFRPFREPGCPHGFILLTLYDRIVHFCCSDQNRKKNCGISFICGYLRISGWVEEPQTFTIVDFVVAVGIWVGFGPELGSEKNSPKINKKLIFMHSISQIYP